MKFEIKRWYPGKWFWLTILGGVMVYKSYTSRSSAERGARRFSDRVHAEIAMDYDDEFEVIEWEGPR